MVTTNKNTGVLSELYSALDPVLGFFSDYPIAVFLVVISISLIVAKVATVIMSAVIVQLTKRTKIHWDDQVINLLSRPVFWTLFLLGIVMAFIPLKLSKSADGIVLSLVTTILIILWSGFILRLIVILLNAISHNEQQQSIIRAQTKPLFQNLAYILVFIFAIYLVFSSWHIDMTAWIASAGIAGIAIGFAAKDTLANLFAGVFILADSPYKIGDYVVLDSGERGKVTHIGIRSTRLLTRSDVEITIPNAVMGNTRISNESGGPHEKFRLHVKVGVAYGSDIDHVRSVLMDVAEHEEEVCSDPEPRVRFRAFGNSSLDIELLCWVEIPEIRGRVLDALNTAIYKRFIEEGIEIPYSKHDLFIKEMPNMGLNEK
ncbi:MAG: mechanosensitive ion channel family protein [Gammaproteobacteria bacterium]|nr:mechanosensitive ion channel family protein [Gammaproteobacteria bacterium]MCW8987957.1 mechanosensitive ion channel family protein [Gammaproteobacteria bacterium]MCW9032077.1 mechanosensitive ion channel family protein [Gammaproteobacteria bacterium]